MQFVPTRIPGCIEIIPQVRSDPRGTFVKTFASSAYFAQHIDLNLAEEYFSVSRYGVLRGLHFQLPPVDYHKLVYCIQGEVFDVLVDLRTGSPTYGQFETFQLNGESVHILYIPSGIAHGFQVTSAAATLVYKVSAEYSPEHDHGIRWDSLNIPWPVNAATLSPRDQHFPAFECFDSPFYFDSKPPVQVEWQTLSPQQSQGNAG